MSDSLRPQELQHARLPCPSPSPGVCSNSCPLSRWRHPAISSSVIPFSSCLQSFPASRSFPVSWLFTSGGQSITASASVLHIQGWFPLGLTGLLSLLSKGLSSIHCHECCSLLFQTHRSPRERWAIQCGNGRHARARDLSCGHFRQQYFKRRNLDDKRSKLV